MGGVRVLNSNNKFRISYLVIQSPFTMRLIPVFLLLTSFAHAQGPLDGFLKGKGVLNIVPNFSFNNADRFFGAPGETYDLPFNGNTLALFSEYGLSERVDVVATGAYVFTSVRSGFQDGGLFVKYRPVYRQTESAGRFSVLLGTGLSFPLSDYEPAAEGALGQKAVVAPLRLLLQWDLPFGLFLHTSGGYNVRFDNLPANDVAEITAVRPDYVPVEPPDYGTILFKLGFPAKHVYLDAWMEHQEAFGGSDYQPGVPDLPQAYGVSYTQAGGTLYYSENGRTGYILSGAYTFKGRNTSDIVRITLGLSFNW